MPERIEGKTALEWYNEGFDLSLQGRYDEAIRCFDRALESDPQHAGAQYNKGDALSNLGRDDEAIQCYGQAMGIKPRNPYEWVQRGLTLALFERDAEAIRSFDQALKIDPHFTSALLFKGDVLKKLGRHTEALRCYERALEVEPDDAGTWKSKGEALKCIDRYDEAIICYDKALMIDPGDADAWYNKGLAYTNLDRCDEAIQCFDQVLEIDPDVTGAWNNKGNMLDDLGRHDEAIECFDRALEIDPGSAIAWNNKGFVLADLGRYAEAIVCYDQAREIDPDNPATKKNRENVLIMIAENEKQRSSETIEHTGTERKSAMQLLEEGVELAGSERPAEALACFEQALKVDPNFFGAAVFKGMLLNDLGHHDEAIASFDRAVRICPEFAPAWAHKGEALSNLSRYNEAIACFDRALEIDPDCAVAWHGKGAALGFLGNHDGALTCFERTLEIDPDNVNAKNNRELALRKIAERSTQNVRGVPQFADVERSSSARPSVSIERTVYDPLTRDFIVSTSRRLVNVKNWIDRHDPASYWLVVCIHNHGNHTIDDWGIELDSLSSLRILDTAIEDIDRQIDLQTSKPKPWLVRSTLGVSHPLGIVIPRNGSRRVYFRLGSESCGVSHSIRGTFITDGAEVAIREKQFQHSCDVATLERVMQQDPALAIRFAEDQLLKKYDKERTQKLLHVFELVYDIKDYYHLKEFECIHDKLLVLQNALAIADVSDNLTGLVQQLNALDTHDGMGRSALELKAQEAERMCRKIIDLWKTEVLSAP